MELILGIFGHMKGLPFEEKTAKIPILQEELTHVFYNVLISSNYSKDIVWKFCDGGDNISALSKVPTLNMKRSGDRFQQKRIRFYQVCISC